MHDWVSHNLTNLPGPFSRAPNSQMVFTVACSWPNCTEFEEYIYRPVVDAVCCRFKICCSKPGKLSSLTYQQSTRWGRDVFASLAPPRNIRTSLLIYCQFQQSDLEFFERVLQLAVQLCNDGRLLLAFLLFLQHFDVEIVHFHTMTLNHTLYVIHNSGWTSGALFSNFIIFS